MLLPMPEVGFGLVVGDGCPLMLAAPTPVTQVLHTLPIGHCTCCLWVVDPFVNNCCDSLHGLVCGIIVWCISFFALTLACFADVGLEGRPWERRRRAGIFGRSRFFLAEGWVKGCLFLFLM